MTPILFVHAKGGPPLEYAIPRIAAHAEVHVLALAPLPEVTAPTWRPSCASVAEEAPREGDALVELICRHAELVGAGAVTTLSEYAVVAVAHACRRLGLAGAGGNVEAARDKRLMRHRWHRAGVPVPGFQPVHEAADIDTAFDRLRPPLLLKAAWSAGSTAHVRVEDRTQAERAWQLGRDVMAESATEGYAELLSARDGVSDFLLEEIVTGHADAWFGTEGKHAWGDYVSVEGIVADGVYHPLCLTGRMPTVPPFTERAGIAPVALPEEAQRRIEDVSRAAVDALDLGTCATHTEIKLGADGEMWVIETAARFGGVMTTRQVEAVHGLDMLGMLVRQLLGEPVTYPERMLTTGTGEGPGAAGSLVVLAADPEGRPWPELPPWDFAAVDWRELLSEGTRIELVRESALPDGTPMPAYEEAGGANAMAALCFLTAESVQTLLADCEHVIAALPRALADAAARTGDAAPAQDTTDPTQRTDRTHRTGDDAEADA